MKVLVLFKKSGKWVGKEIIWKVVKVGEIIKGNYYKKVMRIGGIQKTTLIDYPGKIACTIFTLKCNFRCLFCYSSDLVLGNEEISEEEIFNFLKKRVGLLDGVVICGGEPTVHRDLFDFISKIKDLKYLIKLDTNGSNPEMLKKLVENKKIDYVAMDIKNSKEKYSETVGAKVDIRKIEESVDFLKKGFVDFEFRTTIVPTIHDKEDFINISKWIGSKNVKYFLQNFVKGKTLDEKIKDIHPYSNEYLEDIKKDICSYFKFCDIR